MTARKISRRDALKTSIWAGGALVALGSGAYFMFKDRRLAADIASTLASRLRGEVIQDRVSLREFAYDFGGMIESQPRVVVQAECVDDILETFSIAREYGVPVATRGLGYSCAGQTLSDGGIVLLSPGRITDLTPEDDTVVVPGGSRWLDVERVLNQQGLTNPVLTDYMNLTVGGTLSVGGFGTRSLHGGMQAENVTRLEMVIPDGSHVICSPDTNRDVFRYALCGVGQLGVITAAKLKVVPLKRYTERVQLGCNNVDDFIRLLVTTLETELAEQIDHVCAYWYKDAFHVEMGVDHETREAAAAGELERKLAPLASKRRSRIVRDHHVDLHRARQSWVDQMGSCYHVWEDFVFGRDAFREFTQRVMSTSSPIGMPETLSVAYFLTAPFGTSFPMACNYDDKVEKGTMAYSMGFYHNVPIDDAPALVRAKHHLAAVKSLALGLGGRPYLYGWYGLTKAEMRSIYGPHVDTMRRLKQQYDPDRLVNPVFAPLV